MVWATVVPTGRCEVDHEEGTSLFCSDSLQRNPDSDYALAEHHEKSLFNSIHLLPKLAAAGNCPAGLPG